MYTMVESVVQFRGTPTTEDEREMLRGFGFIHMTGLKAIVLYPVGDSPDHYFIGKNLKASECSKCESNNGVTVINTNGGEVWIRLSTGTDSDFDDIRKAVQALRIDEDGSAFVPISNGEDVNWREVMHRVADPSYGIELVD